MMEANSIINKKHRMYIDNLIIDLLIEKEELSSSRYIIMLIKAAKNRRGAAEERPLVKAMSRTGINRA